jgi:uncharacterized protein YqgC (DUF456 family)
MDFLMGLPTLWWILIVILFILGYLGLVVPALPDMPLILAGFAVYHFLVDDHTFGWIFWTMAIFLTILLFFVDYVSGAVMAKAQGGSSLSVLGAVVGVLTFPWIAGPIGVFAGPFVLVFLIEYLRSKDAEEALKISYHTIIGYLCGIVVKGLLMTMMVVWFLLSVIF